jgi:glycosyltransferase involved in cell wall biosynthesis
MKVVMLPVVSGGMGHIARTAALGRALRRLAPSVEVEYLFAEHDLRPFNLDAARGMGLLPRLLPVVTRQNRDAVVGACFGDADVVVDDAARQWLPCRRVVPQAAWISILMYPVGDELFGDWPLMLQADALIWPYAPRFGVPAELDMFDHKLLRTGPFLETEAVPDKPSARARLGLPVAEPVVVYALRGFPFGRKFGHAVLSGVYGAVERLRAAGQPGLRLVLLAVGENDELRGAAGMPDPLPDWVRVEGVVPPEEALLYARAADILVAEGTSTMHEGAALRTPLVLVPGTLLETLVVAQGLNRHAGVPVFAVDLGPEHLVAKPKEFDQSFKVLGTESLTDAFAAILAGGEAQRERVERAHALVTSGRGAEAAARLVLEVAARPRRASAGGGRQNLFRTTGPGFVVDEGEPPAT